MTRATLTQAMAWLLAVRAGLDIRESEKDARLACRALAASLIKSYEADAFGPDSREAVSATLKWFKEPDIRERLDVWVKVNTRPVQALPDAALAAPLTQQGKQLYGWFLTRPDDTAAIRALNLVRGTDCETFDWVARNDHAAASYAVRMGWTPTPTRDDLASEWDDPEGIERRFQRIAAAKREVSGTLGAMLWGVAYEALITAVRIHAPRHIHLVDPARLNEPVPMAFPPVEPDILHLFGESP